MKKSIWILIGLVVIVGLIVWLTGGNDEMDTPSDDTGDTPDQEQVININSPEAGSEVASPLDVSGEARGTWFFEADFPLRLLDADGNVLTESFASAQGDWMTEEFVPFSGELSWSENYTGAATLVVEKANPSGLPKNADERRIPLQIVEGQGAQRVSVFFSPENIGDDCSEVVEIEREIEPTVAVAQAALEELLAGPMAGEAGITNIPTSTTLNSVAVEDGVAQADFSAELSNYGGGSCRVAAIRSQIEKTLLQFSTVNEVEISIEGESEMILQP